MLLLLGIIILIVFLCKDSYTDSQVRNAAKQNGGRFYASSTGLRDVNTNQKVIISHGDGKLIDVKTGKKY